MKALRRISTGRIAYTNFNSGGVLTEPFRIDANYSTLNGQFILNRGSISFDAFSYSDFILVVGNAFVPSNTTDMGGIALLRGSDKKELFEYYQDGDNSQVPYVKLTKHGDIYTGYSSEDGKGWSDKGYVSFPNADTISITLEGSSPYLINNVSLYKSDAITIYSVSSGWRADFVSNNTTVASVSATSTVLKATLPMYPFSGTVNLYNDSNTLVATLNTTDLWGGDEYSCATDVDLYTLDGTPLSNSDVQHLGNLANNEIEVCYKAKNNTNEAVTVTIQVASYGQFSSWAELSLDYGYASGTYGSSISLPIEANGFSLFWVKVARPADFALEGYNYKTDECSFYLEVV